MPPTIPPLRTSCHCNALSLSTPSAPKFLNECQCSLCRRYGAQWAYYPVNKPDHGILLNGIPITDFRFREDGKLEVVGREQGSSAAGKEEVKLTLLPTRTYSWGDDLEWFVVCDRCGCVMFWYDKRKTVEEGGSGNMGINARMVTDPMTLRFVEKRITFGDAMATKEGVYDENGPIRK